VSNIKRGTGIALLGEFRHFFCETDSLSEHPDYFAMQSIEWYRYARRKLNGHLHNGDLVLITECYKVPSWGYLTYFNDDKMAKEASASFLRGAGDRGLYGWKYEPAKGLLAKEHLFTPKSPTATVDPTAGFPDQCIGFRAYSIHCVPKAWKELEAQHHHDSPRGEIC